VCRSELGRLDQVVAEGRLLRTLPVPLPSISRDGNQHSVAMSRLLHQHLQDLRSTHVDHWETVCCAGARTHSPSMQSFLSCVSCISLVHIATHCSRNIWPGQPPRWPWPPPTASAASCWRGGRRGMTDEGGTNIWWQKPFETNIACPTSSLFYSNLSMINLDFWSSAGMWSGIRCERIWSSGRKIGVSVRCGGGHRRWSPFRSCSRPARFLERRTGSNACTSRSASENCQRNERVSGAGDLSEIRPGRQMSPNGQAWATLGPRGRPSKRQE
jgi:hypothetical protein